MNTPLPSSPAAPDFWLTVLRTMIGRCPKCGQGRLFKSYLKPVDHCANCGEALGHIRADDGPAWLTILVVGHVLGVLILTDWFDSWSDAALLTFMLSLTVAMSLAMLPYAKGFFIGLIWRAGCIGADR